LTTIITQNVGFEVSRQKILAGVNLVFPANCMTAILGPSGSGKSTLLKCLTTTITPTTGKIWINKRALADIRNDFRQQLGYVPQDDIIHRELRVEHALGFAAKLRLGRKFPEGKLRWRVNTVIRQLGLEKRRRLRIRRLSGGQRKRVSIGLELLADPTVLMLDEPASGLDPGTEEDLMFALRALADKGKTVIFTTHSMEYLNRVDWIVLLMEGVVIFASTLSDMLRHFDVSHPADVYRKIREHDRAYWAFELRVSRTARRMVEPALRYAPRPGTRP